MKKVLADLYTVLYTLVLLLLFPGLVFCNLVIGQETCGGFIDNGHLLPFTSNYNHDMFIFTVPLCVPGLRNGTASMQSSPAIHV